MQNFETTFNNLNEIDKKCINAYRSAREFKNIGTQPVVITNNRMYPVIIASIVNNALACELFLKSMIIMNTKEIPKGHSIKKLIIEANISAELKYKLNNYNFDVEIEGVDRAFIEWRYTYERNEMIINNGFLNSFCNALEEISRNKILKKYNLNMLESFI